jgi:hypothetical protein
MGYLRGVPRKRHHRDYMHLCFGPQGPLFQIGTTVTSREAT